MPTICGQKKESISKEYVLVPSNEYERMKVRGETEKITTNPFEPLQKREAQKLHSKMIALGNENSLTDFEKNIEYSQMRNNFLSYVDDIKNKYG